MNADLTSSPVRYPDPAVKVLDERFAKYVVFNAAVQRLAGGMGWTEGPVWFGDQRLLLWSDIPNDRIHSWDERTGAVGVWRQPSRFANGNYRDRMGRLVSCEHQARRVTRTEHDGSITVVMDGHEGHRLNAPNDVTVASDGSVWFTDPGYGSMSDYEGDRGELEIPTAVYRVDADGGPGVPVVTDLARPNGLCFSPDESVLYVVDTDTTYIYAYDVEGGVGAGKVSGRRVFADLSPATSDGIRCDEDGNVWSASSAGLEGVDGVNVYDPDGTLIGHIDLPERCANLCFGGRVGNRLFMTASTSVYSLYVNTRGA